MKLYNAVPPELVAQWNASVQSLSNDTGIAFHYHDVEEWLTAVRGEITFFTLADEPLHVGLGQTLWIPRGEVHRARASPDGVDYQTFVPVTMPDFAIELTEIELDALRANLRFPDYEDGRIQGGRDFFEHALSEELTFCRADGTIVGKWRFIESAFVNRRRASTGSICVLNRSENGLLVSTTVTVAAVDGDRLFTNVRYLAAENGQLRCRLWANYPEVGGGPDQGRGSP